jgi:hypothetical protein
MIELPPDVWAMLLFSVAVFFGGSIWALSYSLFQEERKMKILNQEGALDTYSPRALRDLNDWLHAHPDPDSPVVEVLGVRPEGLHTILLRLDGR